MLSKTLSSVPGITICAISNVIQYKSGGWRAGWETITAALAWPAARSEVERLGLGIQKVALPRERRDPSPKINKFPIQVKLKSINRRLAEHITRSTPPRDQPLEITSHLYDGGYNDHHSFNMTQFCPLAASLTVFILSYPKALISPNASNAPNAMLIQ